ncbi:MAG: hypothetical protein LBP92_05200 [Deltaproteobacteria bacterium]|jgi:hypothetical protein|nr:hypothetical protein [Deltaproteobacteria bacterium]
MAEKTIEYTVKIKNENGEGEVEITVTSSRAIPGFPEFEESGFAAAFHKLEGAILEASKDVNVKVTGQYLSDGSKKSRGSPVPGKRGKS